ncbi:MAG: HYR domain-containing protein, partial [Bacteroidia bacterium]
RPTTWVMALLLSSIFGLVKGSHYAGADFRITWVSGETYTVTERIYRDCRGISLGATSQVTLVRLANNSSQVFNLSRTSITDITPVCPGQTSGCPNGPAFGIEEHIYTGTISNLVANEDYRIFGNHNARNAAITTLVNPGALNLYVDGTFRTGIQNSSPQFLNRPFATFCANQPAVFAPNGFDPDGDAIQYSLTSCRTTGGATVPYQTGFNATSPLSSSTGVSINSNTGAISFTPTVAGQVAVICVRADEYRNGNIIGSIVRDMQVIIQNCSNAPPVIAPLPNVVVNVGQTYCVNVSATDANNNLITLSAVSGIIPPATFVQNTSSAGSATGTFCFTPTIANIGNTYTVTINGQDNACPSPGVGSTSFNITVPVPCNMTASATSTPTACGGNTGTATVTTTNGTAPFQYNWTGPTGFSAGTQTITGLAPGTYTVVVVDGNSCVATATTTVGTGGSAVSATATSTPANCNQSNGSVTISATGGVAPYSYSLDGGSFGSSDTFTGLSSGSHSFSVQDANGCPASGTVTVGDARDLTAPTITCPANISVSNDNGQCGANVSFAPATATDDCGAASVAQIAGPASGSFFPLGTTTITFRATDVAGNIATCSFTVTVSDNQAPSVNCPSNISVSNDNGQCGAAVSYNVGVSDNCPGATVSVVQPSGSFFTIGTSTVIASATDAAGNTAVCSFTVTVSDNEAPSVSCSGNISLNNDPGLCGAVASFSATASDNCPGATVSLSHASGSFFPVGTTTVTATATDAAGNHATCSFTVTVTDNEAPSLDCGVAGGLISGPNTFTNDVTLTTDGGICGAVYEYDNEATDNCGNVTITQTAGLPSGSTFPVGTTTNSFVATDGHGNSTACSFNVTVVDAEAPAITCPANITTNNDAGQCSAAVSYSASATDNCSASVSYSVASGSSFAVGTSTVTATATDPSGNASTCSFTITVIDNEAPSVACQNVTVNLNGSGSASISANDVHAGSNDNCGVASISATPTSFNCSNTGANTVTLTVLDIHGNSSACTATVTVVDAIAPSISCPSNITVSNDAGFCGANVGYAANASDNCSAAVSYSIAPGSFFAVGTASVTATATDPSGNATSCSFTVTVNDNEAPSITCPANVSVSCVRDLPAANTSLVSSSDNCGVASVSHVGDQTSGTGCAGNPRVIVRTYSVTDIHGNVATCTQTLTAQATPVVATASNDVIVFPAYADSSCANISVVGSGGCAPYTYAWSNGSTATSQTVCPTVSTTYYVTVTDAQGCTGVDSVRVCAIDITCVGGTNNGQTGTGQGGNGSTNGNGMVHIAICHIPPGNPNNAMVHCIPVPAARQHIQLGHGGDYLGPCNALVTRPCRNGNAKSAGSQPAAANGKSDINVNVFPNPTNGNLNIEVACTNCAQEGTYTVKVTDIYGKEYSATKVDLAMSKGSTKVDMSRFAAGVYLVVVENGTQRVVERVVKN